MNELDLPFPTVSLPFPSYHFFLSFLLVIIPSSECSFS
jgi:hypothetical protein